MIRKLTCLALISMLFYHCQGKEKASPLDQILKLLFVQEVVNTTNCPGAKGEDPFYKDQWHLNNDGTISGSVSGEDAKVQAVWNGGNYGADVLVAVVDDGLEVAHEDLKDNISTTVAGYNYVNSTTNPTHLYSTSSDPSGHGTNVGGVIAAKMKNGIGVRGAAPCAKLTGRNILEMGSGMTTTAIADAMTKDIASIAISNNSWGATDNTGKYSDSFANSTWRTAIDTGVKDGRGGKGTLYLWAAGNGSETAFPSAAALGTQFFDNANYDGQANYHGVLAIGGIGINGKRAAYSERGANVWVSAHTQGNSTTAYTTAISTTDPSGTAGYNAGKDSTNYSNGNYNNKFNGTSSATPLAAGVIALLLKAKPDLSWRDVREILAKSARKNDATDTDWAVNGANYNINHNYGFGAIDAANAVTVANNWTNITGDYKSEASTTAATSTAIPDNTAGGASTTVTYSGTITKIEYVEVTFNTTHSNFGELTVELTSPAGTKSILVEKHNCLSSSGSYGPSHCTGSQPTMRFGSARHLGESPVGTWTMKVIDGVGGGTTGNFGFSLTIKGRAN